MNASHRALSLLAALALTGMGGFSGIAAAKTTNLGTTPPDLTTTVPPNVAVTFDDSGSMQSFFMGDNRPFDNYKWTTTVGSGRNATEQFLSPWNCAGAIDPRITDKTNRRSAAMNGVYYNPNINYTPPVKADGTPFPNAATNKGTTAANLNYVWFNGIDINRPANAVTSLDAVDYLSNDYSSGDAYDTRVTDMTGTITYRTRSNGTLVVTSDSRWQCTPDMASPFDTFTVDAGDSAGGMPNGGPYYYRLKTTNSSGGAINITNTDGTVNTGVLYNAANWEPVAVPKAQYQNFANWFAYYRTRNMMTRTTLSLAFAKVGNSVRIAWQNLANKPPSKPSTTNLTTRFDPATTVLQDIGAFDSTVRANLYNWMFQVVGGNSTPARAATIRAGELFRAKPTQTATDPYWNGASGTDSTDLTCRKNFHMLVTDGYWNEDDPTLPTASANTAPGMGDGNTSQVAQTLPDAVAYSPTDPVMKIYGNVSGDVYQSSMANIAWYYWATDLQPGIKNGVKAYWKDLTSTSPVDDKAPEKNKDVYWNYVNDPATWQHVSQFYVTLGVAGTLDYPGDLAALLAGTKAWPFPKNNSAEAVDDTWHGGVNSRGGFFNASDPATLVNSLVDIINSVIAATSSAVSPALNTGVISTDSVTYVPKFSSVDWTGTLEADQLTATGGRGALLWEASANLKARTAARSIVTSAGPGQSKGIEFIYANLTDAQKQIMDSSDGSGDATSADTLGKNRIDWIRGVKTDEGVSLRARSNLLGAIINAQPLYVSYPSSGYRDYFPPSGKDTAPETAAYTADAKNSYSQFVADNLKRVPTLYVAANDGMLHAFDAGLAGQSGANPGSERWAYVPDAVYRNLWFFSQKKNFLYRPTVDATPIYRDVYFSQGADTAKGWHTILVGGLRYGGRGIYALDITKPVATSTADAASKVLWEFNSASTGAANLGYTFGQPNIGRLSNGKWVVLVPAGYFPDDAKNPDSTAPAAANTFSSLFVLDAQTGAVLKEFKTPTKYNNVTITSYGLSSPVLGDYNNDQIDDVAFAGDLVGNLWRFDLSDLTKNTVDLIYKPATNEAQPITVMPRLFPDPTSQYFIVVFGTGKFIGDADRTTTNAVTQAVYGVRDPGTGNTDGLPWTLTNLVQQTLVEDANKLRGLTSNPVGSDKKGWYFNLDISGIKGERVVVTPTALFNTNRAIITTLIPTSADPCNPGRTGAIMVVDASTGGAGAGVSGTGAFNNPKISVAGARVDNPPATGGLPAATVIGGGSVIVPGVTMTDSGNAFTIGAPIWRRRSWRILNDQ